MKFFDGAFGTYYISKTDNYEPCELANLNNKETVLSIHNEYISAGATAIKTNTFSANGVTFEDKNVLIEVITEGYLIAKQAALDKNVEVFADIGNISAEEDSQEKYLQVANIFIELGATNFLFETLVSFDEIIPALSFIKEKAPNAVIIVSFAVSSDGFTAGGHHYKVLIADAIANDNVDIVGLNCVCGPTHMLSLVKGLGHLSKPLSVMPNAGYPASVNGRMVYRDNSTYFSEKLLEMHKAGADILGGCCGTTPRHIEKAVQAIKDFSSGLPKEKLKSEKVFLTDVSSDKLKRKPIAVELDPPLDCDMSFILEASRKLKEYGVSTITLADSPLAKTRADSFMTAAMVKQEIDIDVLPHLTCRDKNFIAIKGSLMGASFYGINKVLAITGDPVVGSDNYRNSGVFNFNSKGLIRYIKSLNDDTFTSSPYSIGGAINVNAPNFEAELNRCMEKVENGADFLYSQPIFSDESIANFIEAKKTLGCILYAGILPFVSYKNAVFLNNEFLGIDIPEEIVENLKDKDAGDVEDISISFCHNIIKQVHEYADGLYIITPMKKVDFVCNLIERSFHD